MFKCKNVTIIWTRQRLSAYLTACNGFEKQMAVTTETTESLSESVVAVLFPEHLKKKIKVQYSILQLCAVHSLCSNSIQLVFIKIWLFGEIGKCLIDIQSRNKRQVGIYWLLLQTENNTWVSKQKFNEGAAVWATTVGTALSFSSKKCTFSHCKV